MPRPREKYNGLTEESYIFMCAAAGMYAVVLLAATVKTARLISRNRVWTQQKSFFTVMALAASCRFTETMIALFAQASPQAMVSHFWFNETGFALFVIDKIFIIFFFMRNVLASRGASSVVEIFTLQRRLTRLHIGVSVFMLCVVWSTTGVLGWAYTKRDEKVIVRCFEVSLVMLGTICLLVGLAFVIAGAMSWSSVTSFALATSTRARSRQIQVLSLSSLFVLTFLARAVLLYLLEFDVQVNRFYFDADGEVPYVVSITILEIFPSVLSVIILRSDMREIHQAPVTLKPYQYSDSGTGHGNEAGAYAGGGPNQPQQIYMRGSAEYE